MINTIFSPVAGISSKSQIDAITGQGHGWVCAMVGGYAQDHVSHFSVVGLPNNEGDVSLVVRQHPSVQHLQAFMCAASTQKLPNTPPLDHITFTDAETVKEVLGQGVIDYMNAAGEIIIAIPTTPEAQSQLPPSIAPHVIFQSCEPAN